MTRLGLEGVVRHGPRHTALTRMADSHLALHLRQRVTGHQDPAVAARYLHADTEALITAGSASSVRWRQRGDQKPSAVVGDATASGE